MFLKLPVLSLLLCTASYAAAGTTAIGSASARGDIRVDHSTVSGNATLFDGSVVETDQASAELRMEKGVRITLSTNSRGTLYHDHLVLEQGESEMTGAGSFQVDAKDLRVMANGPDARAVVSLRLGDRVEVAAISGSFGVLSDKGVLLARVTPGQPLSFADAPSAGGGTVSSESFRGQGGFSKGADGNYYLSVGSMKFQVTGSDLDHLVGKTVTVVGTTEPQLAPAGGAVMVVNVSHIRVAGLLGMSGDNAVVGGYLIAGAVTGISLGVYQANHIEAPFSRP
jgi:hypothetical protein